MQHDLHVLFSSFQSTESYSDLWIVRRCQMNNHHHHILPDNNQKTWILVKLLWIVQIQFFWEVFGSIGPAVVSSIVNFSWFEPVPVFIYSANHQDSIFRDLHTFMTSSFLIHWSVCFSPLIWQNVVFKHFVCCLKIEKNETELIED